MSGALAAGAVAILTTADPAAKVAATHALAAAWRQGTLEVGHAQPPERPARPARPLLVRPADVPKRSLSHKGRIAFIHALAHIEFNAVDLAWDIVARFTADALPRAFYDDWVTVAQEEAEHFEALARRLRDYGAVYGDQPAHDSLWEAATVTADDLAARLALIPMTLEARGIDTTPPTVARFRPVDPETADVLERIYRDEIKHLAVGVRWFEFLCARNGLEPHERFAALLAERFTGRVKGPFNLPARAEAGMDRGYLAPLVPGFRNS